MRTQKTFFLFVIAIVFFSAKENNVFAQNELKINDIKKVELFTREGGLGNTYRKLEVVKEGQGWKCYQTERRTNFDDLTNKGRILVKTIPVNLLNDLLKYLQAPDTEKNADLFDIDIEELKNRFEIDNNVALKPAQKEMIFKSFQNKNILNKAVEKVLTPFLMDHRSYYSITATTKSEKTILAEAHSFASSYYLPWEINKQKSYNPKIALAFGFISNDEVFPSSQKYWFYKRVNNEIYQQNFRTKFNWDTLKTEQPKLAEIFEPTLSPTNLNIRDNYIYGYFKSSLLPNYVSIFSLFKKENVQKIKEIKNYEDTLVDVFKRKNFLFDYLEDSGVKVILTAGKMPRDGEYYMKSIRKVYPEIDQFKINKIQLLEVTGEGLTRSKWMLLPNNTLLLLNFFGIKAENNRLKLMNLNLENNHPLSVCILFSSDGKLLKNFGNPEINFSSEISN